MALRQKQNAKSTLGRHSLKQAYVRKSDASCVVVVIVIVKALFLDGNHVTWYIVIFNGPSSYMHTYIIYIHTIKL